jgi:hypothetical protein
LLIVSPQRAHGQLLATVPRTRSVASFHSIDPCPQAGQAKTVEFNVQRIVAGFLVRPGVA